MVDLMANYWVEGLADLRVYWRDSQKADRRVEKRGVCWVETTALELVVRKADWTVEEKVELKVG
jgi:hypothetical protein